MREERRQRRRHRRDKRRERRRIRANPYLFSFLGTIVRWALVSIFNVHTEGLDVLHKQRGAFLLVGNHSAVIDPFLVGCFANRPIHFVAADSQFRSRFVSILFNLVGVIPKTKVLADLDTVKKIVTVKQTGGVIGLFPEGQNGWDGHSLPIIKATDKLVKSLKIPVIAVQIRGAYLSWPRWARRIRRGKITLYFKKILEPADLRSMSATEVGSVLEDALAFDAFEYQRFAQTRFRGPRRAEYLERALFVCPECKRVDTLHSRGQRLSCTVCGYTVRMNNRGFFEPRGGSLYFETIRDWNLWQIDEYHRYIDRFLDASTDDATGGTDQIIAEGATTIEEGYKTQPLKLLGTGPMTLYRDRIEVVPDAGGPLVFGIRAVEGINVQNNEHLEFYVNDTLYRISAVNPRGNTYKWDLAVRYLQRRLSSG
ncbi:MAG: lysophospholipid acyltransferase family protein [Alkalispirochaeta sp.]